jgi:RNA polymerase sigma-70 factor (ECF subfamily)
MAPETSKANLDGFLIAHGALVGRLHAQADAARWAVPREEFGEALYRSAVHRFGNLPDGEALGEYFGGLHLANLALACALRRGAEAAWEEFVAAYRPILYAAARAIVGTAGEARAHELADSLYAELYGLNRKGNQGQSLLNYFHGRSKLSTWLRTVLAQRHVDALRATQRIEPIDEAAPPMRSPAHHASQEPDLDPDRARLLPRLKQAVAGTLDALPTADRLLLSLYYVQEMTLAQIARVQGVHEATISRELERIRRQLREGVEESLATGRAAENGDAPRPGFSPSEIELCFTYAVQDWGFDLGGALSSTAGREET